MKGYGIRVTMSNSSKVFIVYVLKYDGSWHNGATLSNMKQAREILAKIKASGDSGFIKSFPSAVSAPDKYDQVPRKNNGRVKNPSELLKKGEWTPAHAVRIRKGRLEIMR